MYCILRGRYNPGPHICLPVPVDCCFIWSSPKSPSFRGREIIVRFDSSSFNISSFGTRFDISNFGTRLGTRFGINFASSFAISIAINFAISFAIEIGMREYFRSIAGAFKRESWGLVAMPAKRDPKRDNSIDD